MINLYRAISLESKYTRTNRANVILFFMIYTIFKAILINAIGRKFFALGTFYIFANAKLVI